MRSVGEQEPWWELSREEQRNLAITFVGGLGSIVVGACVIGGGIVVARFIEPHHKPGELGSLAVATALCLTGAIGQPQRVKDTSTRPKGPTGARARTAPGSTTRPGAALPPVQVEHLCG